MTCIYGRVRCDAIQSSPSHSFRHLVRLPIPLPLSLTVDTRWRSAAIAFPVSWIRLTSLALALLCIGLHIKRLFRDRLNETFVQDTKRISSALK